MSIYSRPAFLAEKTLADAGIVVTKNHLRELIAALCGFKSLAALQASPWLPAGSPPGHLLVLVNRVWATARCQQLLPLHDPAPILRELVRFLDITAASSVAVHQSPGLPLPSLRRYAKRLVLAAPEMEGHTTCEQDEEQGLGPVSDLGGHVLVNDQRLVVEMTGEYSTPRGDGGLVNLELRYRALTTSLYAMDAHHVDFSLGEDLLTAADIDFQFADHD